MNAATVCHEIPGCPGLYIDAFRGNELRKALDANNVFILSHYHGDHYGNLPRDGKYQGRAKIHCTPVTGALLCRIHGVPKIFVVEHTYGESFDCRFRDGTTAKITLLDANHCPGAAIIFIKLSNGMCHVHTGDMRYHEKMKSYPALQEAARNRTIDSLLLDTTYGNPKHDFIPQEIAVDYVGRQAWELLGSQRSDARQTLVLLSCYSIGKEKVLWEVSNRCNQQIFVTNRKMIMLQCISGHHEDVSSQIISRCTEESTASDIHVIPMGLAGEMWPFFRPNFWACANYARQISSSQYKKVVAFIPTGWADASNWNKKNAITSAKCDDVEVEIRLISYSEHSSFSELQAFVEFLQPRKVIPTVFKDARDAEKIAARFPVDRHRAKKHFINSMIQSASPGVDPKLAKQLPIPNDKAILESPNDALDSSQVTTYTGGNVTDRKRKIPHSAANSTVRHATLDQHSDEATAVAKQIWSNTVSTARLLQDMGFDKQKCFSALEACSGNVEAAIEKLLSQEPTTTDNAEGKQRNCQKSRTDQSITKFFVVSKRP